MAKRVYAKNFRLTDEVILDLNYQTFVLQQIPKEPIFPRDALENLMADLAEENPKIKEINIGELLDNTLYPAPKGITVLLTSSTDDRNVELLAYRLNFAIARTPFRRE